MNIVQALNIRGEMDSYERQENLWLLSDVLDMSVGEIKLNPDYHLNTIQKDKYLQQIGRLNQGEPLAYILGNQPFWTLDLMVNQHTLIPRPDSEIVVETILKLNLKQDTKVLDMGTGTGAIGLALAKENTHWQIYLTDIHDETLKVAQYNAEKHQLKNVAFAIGSWYKAVEKFHQKDLKFNIIVSNPPYLAEDDIHLIELLKFEPKRALVASEQGLSDIIEIIKNSRYYLENDAYVVIEHGWQQAIDVQKIFQQYDFKNIQTIQDYGGNDRVTIAQWVFL